MELRDLRASINAILDELEKRPEDQSQLKDALHTKISTLSGYTARAMPDKPSYAVYADQEDDYFDNLPV